MTNAAKGSVLARGGHGNIARSGKVRKKKGGQERQSEWLRCDGERERKIKGRGQSKDSASKRQQGKSGGVPASARASEVHPYSNARSTPPRARRTRESSLKREKGGWVGWASPSGRARKAFEQIARARRNARPL